MKTTESPLCVTSKPLGRVALATAGLALGGMAAHGVALADSSYQESTQISGGSLADALRQIPLMRSRVQKMFDPTTTQTLLQGNRLATVSEQSTEIIDLDQQTVTHIDKARKTYSVATFDQMRAAFKDAPEKIAQAEQQAQAPQPQQNAPHLQVTFDVSTQDPGISKVVNGVMATEHLTTLKTHVTNLDAAPTDPSRTVTYNLVTDSWIAPAPPEMAEVQQFYVRYGTALMKGVDTAAVMQAMRPAVSNASMSVMFSSQPGMGGAFSQMSEKMADEQRKRPDGVEVLTITRMGGEGLVATPGTGVAPSPPPSTASNNVVGQAAGEVASNTASDVATDQASRLGGFGSSLTRNVLGAFHRHSAPAAAPPASAPPAPATTPADAVLLEMTTQKSQFSADAVAGDAFVIPAGYTKEDSHLGGS